MAQTRANFRFQQHQSLLFRLPQELRDEIYSLVFSTTELAFDDRDHDEDSVKYDNIKALSLLVTCRQIRQEIGDTWIGRVWLSFYSIWGLLEVLTKLPSTTVSKIRLVRVLTPVAQYHVQEHDDIYEWQLDSVIKALPGLCLDKLVVYGLSYQREKPDVDYNILSQLIEHSAGWRELHYVCPNSSIIGHGYMENIHRGTFHGWYRRGPQPSDWVSKSATWDLARGGHSPMSTVTIFRKQSLAELTASGYNVDSCPPTTATNWLDRGWDEQHGEHPRDTQRNEHCLHRYDWLNSSTAWCPYSGHAYEETSASFEQTSSPSTTEQGYGANEDRFLMQASERWKGVRVVVKRSPGADCTVDGPPGPDAPLIACGLYGSGALSWDQMRTYRRDHKLRPDAFFWLPDRVWWHDVF